MHRALLTPGLLCPDTEGHTKVTKAPLPPVKLQIILFYLFSNSAGLCPCFHMHAFPLQFNDNLLEGQCLMHYLFGINEI